MASTNQQGMIAKTQKNKVQTTGGTPNSIQGWIKKYEGEVAKALPSVMTPERFTRIALTAVTNTPKLAECTPQSFIGAMMNAAQLGLEPNTPLGQAYLIPFNSKNGMQCQFQLGYKGMLDLAYRSGEFKNIGAYTVYENDEFEYELGLEPFLKHKPAKANRGKPIYFYATFKLVNGGFGFECMSVDDIKKHAQKYSKTYSNGPWQTDFEAMAKKTVLKQLLKYAPLKTDFAKGVAEDESIKAEISDDMSTVQNDFFEAEYEEIKTDPITGEVAE